MKAFSDSSKDKIKKTLLHTQHIFGSNSQIELWTDEFYQLANRLAFLHLLNNELKIPTWLALVNFTDDETYLPTSLEEWFSHYKDVFKKMDLDFNSSLMNKVITIYPPYINIK